MMTSKSVRRNVTRSWGLSLEKIEFFSTDFLRWVPMPQRDILHSPSSMVTIIMFSSQKPFVVTFSRQKIAQFMKFDDIET